MSSKPRVLVVDDKRNMVSLMKKVLRNDASVSGAVCGRDAIAALEAEEFDVVLCDLKMPDVHGVEVLRACRRLRPNAEFILMTAHASVDTAVDALRLGAYDYLTKPFDPEAARLVVLRALARAAAHLPEPSGAGESGNEFLPGVIGRSKEMLELASLVQRIAVSDSTVLLLGDTGTGKERVSRAIHTLSPRSGNRFVPVNCAAIPGELLESELFGYTKGSFTGANRDRAGLFEEAHEGTLFLDEIGDMRSSLQAKLTRVLEERAIRRIGDSKERPVDVRLIAATHRDIEEMIHEGTFREDLWYRLNVATVRLPPLRDRQGDIELLAQRFLKERARAANRTLRGFSEAATHALHEYDWPGNVRQLRAAVERASIIAMGEWITEADLPPEIFGRRSVSAPPPDLVELTWQQVLDSSRDRAAPHYLRALLAKHRGRVSEAATQAGVERESFYRLLRRYELNAANFRKDPD
ncbi:MAG: sigma-54 dependent transcriptional regulator [Sandaracinaceae bacterium]